MTRCPVCGEITLKPRKKSAGELGRLAAKRAMDEAFAAAKTKYRKTLLKDPQ